jgi:hypothetical protein
MLSACLLLVLVGGAVEQTDPQSTTSVQVEVAVTVAGPMLSLSIDALVNGVPFCIQPSGTPQNDQLLAEYQVRSDMPCIEDGPTSLSVNSVCVCAPRYP